MARPWGHSSEQGRAGLKARRGGGGGRRPVTAVCPRCALFVPGVSPAVTLGCGRAEEAPDSSWGLRRFQGRRPEGEEVVAKQRGGGVSPEGGTAQAKVRKPQKVR